MIFKAVEPGEFKLTNKHLFAYGWLNVPLSIAGLPLAIYIPAFYTKDLGLSMALMGWVLFVGRLFDIVTDPGIGLLSDATPERWGRRRLWMIIGIPLLAITTYMVYSPSGQIGFLYASVWLSLLYLSWTIVSIPYSAWGAELSFDYQVRTRITGWRELLGVVGQWLVMILPMALPWLADHGVDRLADTRGEAMGPLLHVVAIVTAVSLFLALALLLWALPEVRVPTAPRLNWIAGLRVIWRNGPFKRLILVNVFNGIGWTACGTLFVYYVLYVLQEPLAATGGLLLIYYAAGVVGAPLCTWGGNKIGKHRMWAWTIIGTCIAYLPSMFLGPGDKWWFALILSFTGLAIAAGGILGSSMSADVIDIDTIRSGQQRGALFMALWGMASKMAAALGGLISLNLLEFLGFQVTTTGATGLMTLRTLYIALPIICWLIAARIIWNYPITEARHSRIRARVERRIMQNGDSTTHSNLNQHLSVHQPT